MPWWVLLSHWHRTLWVLEDKTPIMKIDKFENLVLSGLNFTHVMNIRLLRYMWNYIIILWLMYMVLHCCFVKKYYHLFERRNEECLSFMFLVNICCIFIVELWGDYSIVNIYAVLSYQISYLRMTQTPWIHCPSGGQGVTQGEQLDLLSYMVSDGWSSISYSVWL